MHKATKQKTGDFARLFVSSQLEARSLVDIELLLVHCWIALHDDGALGHFFHLVQQATGVGFQLFGNVGMHT
jgi:hypothetical protein